MYTQITPIPTKLTDAGKMLLNTTNISPVSTKTYTDDAGIDLRAAIELPIVVIAKGGPVKIPTGIAIDLKTPGKHLASKGKALSAKLHVRSGTKGLKLWNQTGIVDQQYQGEIMLKLYNDSCEDITITPGDRVAQMLIEEVVLSELIIVDEFAFITDRGNNGFNSTGTR